MLENKLKIFIGYNYKIISYINLFNKIKFIYIKNLKKFRIANKKNGQILFYDTMINLKN